VARTPYPDHPAAAMSRLPAPLNVFRMLSHAEPITGPTIDLGLAILSQTTLPPPLRELIIMALASWTDCDYEIAQHTPIALDCGITSAKLDALAATTAENWTGHAGPFLPEEKAVLAATAQILSRHTLTLDVLDVLRLHLTVQQTVETIMTIGFYTMLANLMNGLDIDIDPQGESLIALSNYRTAPASSS